LVTRPRILFLDEPTSGLDSSTSRQVVNSIKNIARQDGTIVICTIHQPNYETFKLFDKVLILADGKSIYSGNVGELGFSSAIGN
jgi:ABC-type multidrug transport system ATPase subunit